MKKSLITLLLTAFCWTAFAMSVPQQDTTRKKQDTTKRHDQKKKSKMKNQSKKDSTWKDSTKRKTWDTLSRAQKPM
ncbi:hypothetical protein [Pedobacter antarcticus]|uniref:Uncharacterized protein n=2 Tax=Pedobacter antarcticus TaxID=34086 RepID=A0A081PBT7_9SPHI|nr:hypothetical protein [Pedobacter antarcticus]KEQ28160.1 hypothetical protein N180_00550 [Pedobacter antarcticus 4BY]SDL40941.1 hypothetical protein SAMN04488084_101194 [Pedobacter antarcticus]SFE43967.1 hypothetical protein SAMN03003324_00476 [Pedobacter antarcticus]